MPADQLDEERATVMTYVPGYQKERWKEHAEELGMSQSEFIRTMVQAGRRDFEVPESGSANAPSDERVTESDPADESNAFEERVVAALSASEFRSWDELHEELSTDLEARLEDALQRLQASDRVRHSGRHGGYALTDTESDR
jgi:hypothetical protein